jgi:predicted hydrolase (HD superfamily)
VKIKTKLKDEDLHPHIKARMLQRGIAKEEIEKTLAKGWNADDAKSGTLGKVFVFPYNSDWEGKFFKEK